MSHSQIASRLYDITLLFIWTFWPPLYLLEVYRSTLIFLFLSWSNQVIRDLISTQQLLLFLSQARSDAQPKLFNCRFQTCWPVTLPRHLVKLHLIDLFLCNLHNKLLKNTFFIFKIWIFLRIFIIIVKNLIHDHKLLLFQHVFPDKLFVLFSFGVFELVSKYAWIIIDFHLKCFLVWSILHMITNKQACFHLCESTDTLMLNVFYFTFQNKEVGAAVVRMNEFILESVVLLEGLCLDNVTQFTRLQNIFALFYSYFYLTMFDVLHALYIRVS